MNTFTRHARRAAPSAALIVVLAVITVACASSNGDESTRAEGATGEPVPIIDVTTR